MVIMLFDPHKLDISDEFKRIIMSNQMLLECMVSWKALKVFYFFSTYIQMVCVVNKGLLTGALVANENATCICIAWSQCCNPNLGFAAKARACKVWAKSEAQKSHFMFLGM
jgi:hypothetical protein